MLIIIIQFCMKVAKELNFYLGFTRSYNYNLIKTSSKTPEKLFQLSI